MGLIQALYWFAFIALLLFSWSRSRGILHPHFMFCVMLFILASDFMIRGMEAQDLQGIMSANLLRYQLATLATMIGLGLSTMVVRRPYELAGRILQPEMKIGQSTAYGILLFGIAILVIHQAIRLAAVDWSVDQLLQQMLGPRDTRLWDQPGVSGARNPVYQLLNGMVPLVATSFAFLIFAGKGATAVLGAVMFLICGFVLVTDGSRTQAIIPMASLAVFGMMSMRSTIAKFVLVGGVVVLMVVATSAMILFRAQGLEGSNSSFALTYHQDDSIYRIWSAAAFADFSAYRWDPLQFFYYVIALPVPRIIWPGKPLLDEDFYSGFKLWYVTTTFMGEWISMLGSWLGFVAAFVFGNLVFRVFYFAQRLLAMPFGVPAYLLVALYTYMILRSMPNMTSFIFAPAAALILVYFARRRQSASPALATKGNPAWSN